MGTRAARVTDMCSGHGCWPPRPAIGNCPRVFLEGLPAHRQGDSWAAHCCKSCHSSALCMGSPRVYTCGQQQGRQLDPVCCGSVVSFPCAQRIFVGP